MTEKILTLKGQAFFRLGDKTIKSKEAELAIVKPKVMKVEGPYNDKDELLTHVELGQTYYYYATLNVGVNTINPKQVKWAVGYDSEKYEKQYYLFTGKEIVGNIVRISISIGGNEQIKKKIKEKFRIYAYVGLIPNTETYVEVKTGKVEITLPVLIARSMRRAGITKDSSGKNNLTREDITNWGFNLLDDKEKLRTKLNEAYDKLGYKAGWFSNYDEKKKDRVEYALEQIENYNKKTDAELFEIMINDLDDWAMGDLDDNVVSMVDFFRTNTSSSNNYEDIRLTKAIAKHSSTINFINGVAPLIGVAIKDAKGDIALLKVKDDKTQFIKKEVDKDKTIIGIDGLQELTSLKYSDTFSGLGISVNGIQAYNIYITEFKKVGSNYDGKFELEILDHFGLDGTDILGDSFYDQEEFTCWYILQHLRNYKPFITKIKISYSFSGALNSNTLNIKRDEL